MTYAALPASLLDFVQSDRVSWPTPSTVPPVVTAAVLESRRSIRSWSEALQPSVVAAATGAAMAMDAALWPAEEPLGAAIVTPDAHMLMQLDLAAAPALVLWHGDIAASVAAHGGSGYRLLLTRGGAAAATFLLHVQQNGGAGCLTDGLLPPLRDDIPPAGRLALIGAAVGVPAQEETVAMSIPPTDRLRAAPGSTAAEMSTPPTDRLRAAPGSTAAEMSTPPTDRFRAAPGSTA